MPASPNISTEPEPAVGDSLSTGASPGRLRWVFGLIGAASCWWLAFELFQNAHVSEAARTLPRAEFIFILEFVAIHSGMMLPGILSSPNIEGGVFKSVLMVSCIYVVFGVAIALSARSWPLFLSFSGIMISRWMGLVTDSRSARRQQMKRSMVGFLLFFMMVLALMVLGISWDTMLTVYFFLAGWSELLESFQHNPWLLLFRILSIGIVAGGVAMAVPAARDLYFGYASRHWPAADGVLRGSWMRQSYSEGGRFWAPQHLQFEAKVTYDYLVAGQRHTGTNITWVDRPLTDQMRAQAILDKYSTHYVVKRRTIYTNPPVTVYYDAQNPSRAVLEPGPAAGLWKLVVAGWILSCFGILLLIKAITTRDRGGTWDWGGGSSG